jgi:hypothetical protein
MTPVVVSDECAAMWERAAVAHNDTTLLDIVRKMRSWAKQVNQPFFTLASRKQYNFASNRFRGLNMRPVAAVDVPPGVAPAERWMRHVDAAKFLGVPSSTLTQWANANLVKRDIHSRTYSIIEVNSALEYMAFRGYKTRVRKAKQLGVEVQKKGGFLSRLLSIFS